MLNNGTMENKVDKLDIDGWIMRMQRPAGSGPHPIVLMLHGWTGDERSMWVFAPRLLKDAMLIAPRGLYASPSMGGYSWYPHRSRPFPWIDDFSPAVEKLLSVISTKNFPDADLSRLHIVGFSQGAALAYSFTIMHPERVASLAGLSGFLPEGASHWLKPDLLTGLRVFITHGTLDNLVPVERARSSVASLEQAGALVTYCEDDVEHKLSAKCFRGLEAFYQKLKTS